ncbi:MAG: acetate--CoA ligase family protein [Nitrospiraceae bacterium]|nr:acetate--CoA ligase family protein [Nitrospiraceae bacterium]
MLKEKIQRLIESAGGEKIILEHEAKGLLRELGLDVPRGVFIERGKKSAPAGETVFPAAVKTVSRLIKSKSGAQALRLGVRDENGLGQAIDELAGMEGALGVLVEEMVTGGIEAIAGGTMDAQFGPVVMFGLGGLFVEVFEDVAFALAPVNREGALWLVSQIKGHKILKGLRGMPPVDMDALAGAVVTVSEIIATGLVAEIDLNPVALFPDRAVVLDAKIFLP